MAGFRSSQIMKRVRVTKIAVTMEATMPRMRVTAKPLHRPGAELEEEERR